MGGFCLMYRWGMTRFFSFLLWMFIATCPAIAADVGENVVYYPETITCASTGQYQKCARLPLVHGYHANTNGVYAHISKGTALDEMNWTSFRNGAPVVGTASVDSSGTSFGNMRYIDALCTVTSPFYTSFIHTRRYKASTTAPTAASICAGLETLSGLFMELPMRDLAVALDGDTCPDGFFTVPWESWCGEGMVNIADVPNCDDDTSGEYCLIASDKVACESGVSNIKTSAGVIVPLYAEKYTEPALAVRYNGLVCYANLADGQSAGAINVKYNGAVYHTEN